MTLTYMLDHVIFLLKQGQTLTFTPRLKKLVQCKSMVASKFSFKPAILQLDAKYVQFFFVDAVTLNMTFPFLLTFNHCVK
jgi:hypothetical protein